MLNQLLHVHAIANQPLHVYATVNHAPPQIANIVSLEQQLVAKVLRVGYDGSPLVRQELGVVLCRFVAGHGPMLQVRPGAVCCDTQCWFVTRASLGARGVLQGMLQTCCMARLCNPYTKPACCWLAMLLCHSVASALVQPSQRPAPAPLALQEAIQLQQRKLADMMPSYRSAPPGGDSDPSSLPSPEGSNSGGTNNSGGDNPMAPERTLSPQPTHAHAHDDLSSDPTHAQQNVYGYVLEAMLLLATDPSPKVARLGREALRLAQCELTPLAVALEGACRLPRSTPLAWVLPCLC